MNAPMTSKTVTVKGREYLVQEWAGTISVIQRRKTGWYRVTSQSTIEAVLREYRAASA